MKYLAFPACMVVALMLACAGAQTQQQSSADPGVVLKDTYVYTKPGGGDTEGKVKVNRGESVVIKQQVKETAKGWINVILSDKETSGWIVEKYLYRGPKIVITLTQNSTMYVRPDTSSKVLTTLPSGTSLLVLKNMEEWRKVSVDYEKEGWINTSSFIPGTK